ncbi:MAG: carboxypeptidase regulatory-like domain-containing protein [Niastella sp.]|nr:carboxypeptidase regulatory-like domain-containing protein [Niastella sp.]
MPAPLHINVAEPCHENWQQMTSNEQGRHCLSCQKTVVDFTLMSDQEILHYISNASSSVCGRFYNHQLDKTYEEKKLKPAFTFRYAWNLITAAFLLTGSAADAQVKKKAKKKTAVKKEWAIKYKPESLIDPKYFEVLADQVPTSFTTIGFTISKEPVPVEIYGNIITREAGLQRFIEPPLKMFGFIRDSYSGKPIEAATIRLKGVKAGVEAGKDGRFEFPIVDISGKVTLEVTAKGYITREYEVDVNSFKSMEFSLRSDGSIVYDKVGDWGTTMGDVAIEPVMGKVVVEDSTLVVEELEDIVCNDITMGTPVVRIPDVVEKDQVTGYDRTDKPVKFDSLEPVEVVGYRLIHCTRGVPNPPIKKDELPISMDSLLGGKISCPTIIPAATTVEKVELANKELLSVKTDVRIYPNPIIPGNAFNISLNLDKTGEYKLELMDASGRVVHIQVLQIAQKTQIVNVPTQSSWSHGIYWIRITNSTDRKVYQAKLLLQ